MYTRDEVMMSATPPAVTEIGGILGETAEQPLAQLATALEVLGEGALRAILAETLAIEAGGGETIMTGKRRRTPGGVFFRLVRERATGRQRRAIFPPPPGSGKASPAEDKESPAKDEAPVFTWEHFGTMAPGLASGAGEATTVKITVIGRPGRVQPAGEVVLVALQSGRAPSLPKGLPTPEQPTDYAVLIARKQWAKVEAALRQPDDRLIVEGYPTFDPRFAGITVLATQVTTRDQQAAKRAEQQAAR